MADKRVLLEDWVDVSEYNMSFKFNFVEQTDGTIFIYILSQPSYKSGQDTSGHATHRYGLSSGILYICYDPQPRNLQDAKVIALEWAKRTSYYIKFGKWFNKGEL